MMMKKLAIASAVALMSMGSVYAQQTTVTTNVPDNAPGLMTTLSNSVSQLFGTVNIPAVAAVAAIPAIPAVAAGPDTFLPYVPVTDAGKLKYVLDINGGYRVATTAELALPLGTIAFFALTPGTPAVAASAFVPAVIAAPSINVNRLVDITALGGAVNLSAINGGINITGTNIKLAGLTGALTGLSTTVIGAMNSSTLDIAKSTLNVSDKFTKTLGIDGLANQGIDKSIGGLAGLTGLTGVTNLLAGNIVTPVITLPNTQFNLSGLSSSTENLSTRMEDKLQNMNVFNMAVNMAPLVAGVNIAATLNPHAWYMAPQTGEIHLSGLQVATTAIGAMNSSITRLGAKLSN